MTIWIDAQSVLALHLQKALDPGLHIRVADVQDFLSGN